MLQQACLQEHTTFPLPAYPYPPTYLSHTATTGSLTTHCIMPPCLCVSNPHTTPSHTQVHNKPIARLRIPLLPSITTIPTTTEVRAVGDQNNRAPMHCLPRESIVGGSEQGTGREATGKEHGVPCVHQAHRGVSLSCSVDEAGPSATQSVSDQHVKALHGAAL